MKEYKVPVQSLIDHIKTAIDVDPWAKEMAEELLKEQEAVVRCKDCKQGEQSVLPNRNLWCRLHEFYREPDWFCADGERATD